jgi:hypothetical protein
MMASLAVHSVVGRLDGNTPLAPRDLLITPHLVVRGTTGPARRTRQA